MKNFLNKYGIALIIAAFLVIVPATSTHAQSILGGLFGFDDAGSFIETVLAMLMNILINIMSILVAVAGYLLNFSMDLTLSIKSFVDSTPAIFTTWRTIRDISGLFMIFFLLYAAFQLITGLQRPDFGNLIKNIVMAGILINFSFFVAGLGIDASNIVSVQLYNAIAPKNNLSTLNVNANIMNPSFLSKWDGGLADIFMNHLHIQSIYNNKISDPTASAQNAAGAALTIISGPIKVILMGAVALIIEFAAAVSFGAAAIAFIFRFVVLLLLLAFSPIMALGFLPEVGAYSKKWTTQYMNMLIFMPVYLLLMYVALSVLTTSPIFNNGAGGAMTAGVGNNSWYSGFIVLGVNATIVIVLLNLPLAAAASIAGGSMSFLKKASERVGYDKWFGKASGYAGAHTAGWAANKADKALGKTWAGNTLLGRDIRSTTTGALTKSKFGGERSHEDYKKEAKTTANLQSERVRNEAFKAALGNIPKDSNDAEAHKLLKSAVGDMNGKARTGALSGLMGDSKEDKRKALELMKYMKSGDFADIKKAEAADWSDADKKKIGQYREEALRDAVANKQESAIENIIDNMSGEDLMKLKSDNFILDNPLVIPHLKPNQLKSMADEGLNDDLKKKIGKAILASTDKGLKTRGYINRKDNAEEWGGQVQGKKGEQKPEPSAAPEGLEDNR